MKEVVIDPVFKVVKILFQRKYVDYGYVYRREIVDDSGYGGNGKLELVNCYSLDTGCWIGSPQEANHLCRTLNLRDIQKRTKNSCVGTLGFNKRQKRWYGWSHRAICGFTFGNKVFEVNYGDDKTPYRKHGKVVITSLALAKKSAKRFARHVS